MNKFILFTSFVFALSFSALADEHQDAAPHWSPTPPVELNTQTNEIMTYCLSFGVRAAWGAQARFLNAPATFIYIPEAPLKKMFYGQVQDIPTDGIYVLDSLDLSQRREYEEAAFYGWKSANKWMLDNKDRPEYEVLSAIFYDGCKKQLTTEMK